jgi:hypothetical protein
MSVAQANSLIYYFLENVSRKRLRKIWRISSKLHKAAHPLRQIQKGHFLLVIEAYQYL